MKKTVTDISVPTHYVRDISLFLPLWLCAMAWHLWRIATFRPMFSRLGDNGRTVFSFAIVYFAMGLIRWNYVGESSVWQINIGLVVHAVLLMLLFERKHRSSSCVSVLLGASAVVDLVALMLTIAGFTDGSDRNAFLVIEVALYAVCVLRFFRETPEVQARGYLRKVAL